jgi:hypothetical protein
VPYSQLRRRRGLGPQTSAVLPADLKLRGRGRCPAALRFLPARGFGQGGQIVVSERFEPGGEPFTSLSSAAAYARGTQSTNGWEFSQLQTRRERRPLKELRDELIRGER